MKILSVNPGHDGPIVDITEGHLTLSIEAEKASNYRYSPISGPNMLKAIGEIENAPDTICVGGRDHHEVLHGSSSNAGDRDLDAYTVHHGLDGFVANGRVHLLKSSKRYQAYLANSVKQATGAGEVP